jgi:hypothetical protein
LRSFNKTVARARADSDISDRDLIDRGSQIRKAGQSNDPAPESARKAFRSFCTDVKEKAEAEVRALSSQRDHLKKKTVELEKELMAKPEPQGLNAKFGQIAALDMKIATMCARAPEVQNAPERAALQKEILELQAQRRALWPEVIALQIVRLERTEVSAKIAHAKNLSVGLAQDIALREELARQMRAALAGATAYLIGTMTTEKAQAIAALELKKLSPDAIWEFLSRTISVVDPESEAYFRMKDAIARLQSAEATTAAGLEAGRSAIQKERAVLRDLLDRQALDAIHAVAEKLHRGRVAEDVRAHPFSFQRGALSLRGLDVSSDEPFDRIAAELSAARRRKEWVSWLPLALAEPGGEYADRVPL